MTSAALFIQRGGGLNKSLDRREAHHKIIYHNIGIIPSYHSSLLVTTNRVSYFDESAPKIPNPSCRRAKNVPINDPLVPRADITDYVGRAI